MAAAVAAFPDASTLEKQNARFAPTKLEVDLSALPAPEKAALARIIDASRLIDAIYLRQTWAGAPSLLLDLQHDTSPLGRARLHAFLLNRGPWSRLDHDVAVLPGVPSLKPESGNFYPAGATKSRSRRGTRRSPRRCGSGRRASSPPSAAKRTGGSPRCPIRSNTRAN